MKITELVEEVRNSSDSRLAASRIVSEVVAGGEQATDILDLIDGPINETLYVTSSWVLLREALDHISATSHPETAIVEAIKFISRNEAIVDEAELYRTANRLAWAARGHHYDATSSGMLQSSKAYRFGIYFQFEAKRFLFQADGIREDLESLANYNGPATPFLDAMSGFALLNSKDIDVDHGVEHLRHAWKESYGSALGDPVADICLHALWLAHRMDSRAELLLEFCDKGESEGRPGIGLRSFRRATALRLFGRFDEARMEIDRVLNSLSGSNEFVRTFSEQCIREREIIDAGQELNRQAARGEEALASIKDDVSDIERRSTGRSIEIVTLFTAVVAFAVGSLNIAAGGDRTVEQTFTLIGGFGLSLLLFSIAIVASTVYLNSRDENGSRIGGRKWLIYGSWMSVVVLVQGAILLLGSP